MLLQGLFIPVTCPFDREGKSYLRKLEHNVRRYSLAPIAGMLALAPGTEAAGLTDAEAKDTLRSVAAAAAKQKVLIAGVERGSVHAALQRIDVAAEAGFDAILLAAPGDGSRLVHGAPVASGVDVRELGLFYP